MLTRPGPHPYTWVQVPPPLAGARHTDDFVGCHVPGQESTVSVVTAITVPPGPWCTCGAETLKAHMSAGAAAAWPTVAIEHATTGVNTYAAIRMPRCY